MPGTAQAQREHRNISIQEGTQDIGSQRPMSVDVQVSLGE